MIRKVTLQIIVALGSILLIASCDKREPAIAEWPHAAVAVLDAVISTDARYALVSSVNFGAGYWDLENNQLLFQWRHDGDPQAAITAVNISADNSRAITAASRYFSIWNTNSGKSYGYWEAPSDIRAIAISNKGRYVLLGLASGLAIHIDMNTGRRLEFTGHRNEAVASVDLSANGLWAFTGGNDYRAILWNSRTGKPRHLFEHKTRVTKLKLDSSGKQAFTSGTLGNGYIWDLSSGAEIARLDMNKREYVISAASFSHNGQRLVTGSPGKAINLWDSASGQRLKKWSARTRDQGKPSGAIIYALGFSLDDRYVFSESSAGFGEKWQVEGVK